ncbi:hypothetical protein EYF80_053345 [Liparis tanakae]|uniref:Uncharacterized protein n=1 Tax=Liparis tanakae TaxID=230148 RepID=A0A4Z2F6L0_9TELE|nr:hypothetical protein EYF80_053345 [Liparis tanakae]
MSVINRASPSRWCASGALQVLFRCVPSTRVDTAIRASSWTPPEPAVLWNILSRDAITTSEICRASRCCTLRRTFFNTGKHKKSVSTGEPPTKRLSSAPRRRPSAGCSGGRRVCGGSTVSASGATVRAGDPPLPPVRGFQELLDDDLKGRGQAVGGGLLLLLGGVGGLVRRFGQRGEGLRGGDGEESASPAAPPQTLETHGAGLTQQTLEATRGSAPRPSMRHCSSGARYTSLMAASGSSSQIRPTVQAVVDSGRRSRGGAGRTEVGEAHTHLFGEGLGQDGDQVLQGPFGVEFTGVLGGASLLRGLPLDESTGEEGQKGRG